MIAAIKSWLCRHVCGGAFNSEMSLEIDRLIVRIEELEGN